MNGIVALISLGIFLVIYGILNYYIGYKGSKFIKAINSKVNLIIYWIIFWGISMSYPFDKIFIKYIPENLNKLIDYIGSFWIAIFIYLLMALLSYEIIHIIVLKTGVLKKIPLSGVSMTIYVGLFIIIAIGTVISVGYINADKPTINSYPIDIAKKAGNLTELKAIMVSDIHLGSSGHENRLKKMVDEINTRNPDIVLLCGDIINDDFTSSIKKDIVKEIPRLKAKYGVFAVNGNHEYYGGDADEFVKCLKDIGVQVLLDESVKVADSFYISGRKDRSQQRENGSKRLSVDELLKNVDKSLPIIMLDHQPYNLDISKESGVDLQLSGHTHKGQLFPNNLFTQKMYELNWGYQKRGLYQVIVSSGFGTWGPPIRLGSKAEIVEVNIRFGT